MIFLFIAAVIAAQAHARQNRRAFAGIAVVIIYLINWEITIRGLLDETNDKNSLPKEDIVGDNIDITRPTKQRKVFAYRQTLQLRNSTSSKLIFARDDEKHLPDVIWVSFPKAIEGFMPLVIESMYLRVQRHSQQTTQNATTPNQEEMKAFLLNHTMEQLNEIDPEWQIFLFESSDGGMGVWPYWFMQHEMAPLLGYNRTNYSTRSTQNDKNLNFWMGRVEGGSQPDLTIDEFVGTPINFSDWKVTNERANLFDKGVRSIQRHFMTVRDDIVDAIDEYMKEKHPLEYEEVVKNRTLGKDDDVSLHLSSAVANLPRNDMDVRTFWNATVCNLHCKFRNEVSNIIASIPERHPHANIRTNTDVIGYIHTQGRNQVHPGYIHGILSTKIIVLAQRDHWEGHARLCEGLVSGALVMHDPQVYLPYGLVDGENIVIYHSWVDLETKILYYLDPKNEAERRNIGKQGREAALMYLRPWQQLERLFLNDMTYRNEYGLANKPFRKSTDSIDNKFY